VYQTTPPVVTAELNNAASQSVVVLEEKEPTQGTLLIRMNGWGITGSHVMSSTTLSSANLLAVPYGQGFSDILAEVDTSTMNATCTLHLSMLGDDRPLEAGDVLHLQFISHF
jgi:hypothetical protein